MFVNLRTLRNAPLSRYNIYNNSQIAYVISNIVFLPLQSHGGGVVQLIRHVYLNSDIVSVITIIIAKL